MSDYPYDLNLLKDQYYVASTYSGESSSRSASTPTPTAHSIRQWNSNNAPSIFTTDEMSSLPPYSSPPPSTIATAPLPMDMLPEPSTPFYPHHRVQPSEELSFMAHQHNPSFERTLPPVPESRPVRNLHTNAVYPFVTSNAPTSSPERPRGIEKFRFDVEQNAPPGKLVRGSGLSKESRRKVFIAIALLLLVGAAVGAGVGATLGKKHTQSAAASPTSSGGPTSTTASLQPAPSPSGLITLGATYTLTNVASGTVANYNQGTGNLTGFASTGGNYQEWTFEDAGNGQYYMRALAGLHYVSITGNPRAWLPLALSPTKQAWEIIPSPIEASNYKIRHPSADLSFDLYAGLAANNTVLQLNPTCKNVLQDWTFKEVAQPSSTVTSAPIQTTTSSSPGPTSSAIVQIGTVYILTNAGSGTVANYNQGTGNLTGWGATGGTNQQWTFEDAGNGMYYMKSVAAATYVSYVGEARGWLPLALLSAKQPWQIIPAPYDTTNLKIRHPWADYSFDLYGSLASDNTVIQLNPTFNSTGQEWIFKAMNAQ